MPRALGLALLLSACRTITAAPAAPVSVQRLEVSFDAPDRGELDLGLEINGPAGMATQAQWQLLIDGHPVGSGVQLLSHRLAGGRSSLTVTAPLPLPHANRDDGWRNVTLELSGELTVTSLLAERYPFAFRRQALVRGAPRP